ncbi:hypothetical protein QRX60_30215 [Amycolatopsis mongoliensis]|uniref:Uncharacterized protein n=1 Tax=Amycolatopsis mongoliensis TaxID=715475 RepID=A0A9Y2JH22_9PSEU|nr:hypothetical protein [Amycolatopsis sp. 4-36]WIX98332.1 hypothetical protein QRX60_30215 [Amycolatopsis sp. 4-36]
MVIALVLGLLVLVPLAGWAVSRRWRSGAARAARPHFDTTGWPAAEEERALTARVLAGELTRSSYRDAMARLAEADGHHDEDVAMLLWRARLGPAGDDGPRDLLDRLGTTLPGVLPGILCSAAVLASTGAGVDDLMRTFPLTRVQARTVIDAVTTP